METPKVTKKGDQVITSYVDEKTGKFSAYEIGIKLEVSDFSGQWFPAKIVEVDKGEKEVLVHFENWSARFDEWIKMDSNRLRPTSSTNIVKTQFKIGENVEALWNTDGQRYPGVIHNILPNDYYQVLFDDGIKLKKKYNQIFKLKPKTRKSSGGSGLLSSTSPLPPLHFGLTEDNLQYRATASPIETLEVANSLPKPCPVSPLPPTAAKTRKRKVAPPTPVTSSNLQGSPEESPVSTASTEEPLSAKRKRTVKDYSDLLRVRRRFSPYAKKKEGEIDIVKRPQRHHRSLVTELPELSPETFSPAEVQKFDPISKSESVSETVAEPIPPVGTTLSLDSAETESSLVSSLPLDGTTIVQQSLARPKLIPPRSKSKPKKKFRPFNSSRKRIKKQRIKYVTVDDEEFFAAGGKLNRSLSEPVTPGRGQENVNENGETSSTPSTPSSVKKDSEIPESPTESGSGLRIIKRRRRRTYARLHLMAAAEAVNYDATASRSPASTSADEPLSKRKRTIHDYSMLLKTRPKFFFDIDAEQERPGMQPTVRKTRQGSDPSEPGLTSLSFEADGESIDDEDEFLMNEPLDKKYDSHVLSSGPTSIATHRPVRRSSSQFARKSNDKINLLSTRGDGFKTIANISFDDSKIDRSFAPAGRRGSFKSEFKEEKRRPGRPPVVKSHSYPESDTYAFDDDELPDIGYSSTAPSPITKLDPQPPPVKQVVKRKSRLGNQRGDRWWKRRQTQATSDQDLEEGLEVPLTITPQQSPSSRPGRRSRKVKRRPGDLLSGLTLNRIRTIRNNLLKRGFKKRILAEPAPKEVSVDIISCICGSNDEHGLMVQCEFCQSWQHGQCFEIETVTDMPKNYVCGACLYPENVRSRKPFDFQQDFYKVGRIPRFGFGGLISPRLTKSFQESNLLIQRLYQVRTIIHTSRVHMNLMEAKPDHPKLYQWDKPHETIQESQQERKFNKYYRPLLRRLLYFNKDDPGYVGRLRAKVESVVNRRANEERKIADKRLTEKFPAKPIPSPIQKRLTQSSPFKTPAIPPLLVASSKETKRLEAEALRIRKELETLNKPKIPLAPAQVPIKLQPKISVKVEVVEKVDLEITSVMEDLLSKVESLETEVKEEPVVEPIPVSVPISVPLPSRSSFVVDLGEAPPPEFPDLDDLPDIDGGLEIKNEEGTTPKIEHDFNATMDLMNLDPSDPKFSTIAADLVKSCCEEPESLIKTLEDLASVAASVTTGHETTQTDMDVGVDTDLISFLDEALHGSGPVMEAPPIPQFLIALPPVISTQFLLPPPPPRLTRLTPELCRGNLSLTILDQQRTIDQHLDEIEARVAEMEKLRGADLSRGVGAFQRITALQSKVKRMMREFELVKGIGRKAERSLREVIHPGLEDSSGGSEFEEAVDPVDNEETESADEDPYDEELSELEDL